MMGSTRQGGIGTGIGIDIGKATRGKGKGNGRGQHVVLSVEGMNLEGIYLKASEFQANGISSGLVTGLGKKTHRNTETKDEFKTNNHSSCHIALSHRRTSSNLIVICCGRRGE